MKHDVEERIENVNENRKGNIYVYQVEKIEIQEKTTNRN